MRRLKPPLGRRMGVFRLRGLALLAAVGVTTLGLVACFSSSQPTTPSPSLPSPGAGKITFYLGLPANTNRKRQPDTTLPAASAFRTGPVSPG
jgi:hypothetical protein